MFNYLAIYLISIELTKKFCLRLAENMYVVLEKTILKKIADGHN